MSVIIHNLDHLLVSREAVSQLCLEVALTRKLLCILQSLRDRITTSMPWVALTVTPWLMRCNGCEVAGTSTIRRVSSAIGIACDRHAWLFTPSTISWGDGGHGAGACSRCLLAGCSWLVFFFRILLLGTSRCMKKLINSQQGFHSGLAVKKFLIGQEEDTRGYILGANVPCREWNDRSRCCKTYILYEILRSITVTMDQQGVTGCDADCSTCCTSHVRMYRRFTHNNGKDQN